MGKPNWFVVAGLAFDAKSGRLFKLLGKGFNHRKNYSTPPSGQAASALVGDTEITAQLKLAG